MTKLPDQGVGARSSRVAPDLNSYIEELRREFPKLRLLQKRHDCFSKALNLAVKLFTAGGQSAYMSSVVTTIGCTVYLPENWSTRSDADRYIVMRHEAIHLRQFRRYGFVRMTLMYLLLWFPIGLAWFRSRLEWEAFEETLWATYEVLGIDALHSPQLEDYLVSRFTTGAYGWMWPFPRQVRRWVRKAIQDILSTPHRF